MDKIIDLHIHTNKSDGALSPKEVVEEAIKNRVSAIAIADHDTIDAYSDELFDYAESNNIILVPAVEISTKTKKCGIHVLGYNFDLNDQNFREKLEKLRNARHDYLYGVSEKLEELGYKVNVDELDKIEAVTKAHISLDVISNKENEEILMKNFGHIPNKGEFIETVMNEGCPAYVKKVTITPSEAADLIRSAGGKAVLAHPVAYSYEDGLTEEDILELVKDMKVEAIEGNYLYVDRDDMMHDDTDKWNTFAKNNNLISTIGSDFHNKDGLRPEIGFRNTDFTISREEISSILSYLSNNE